MLERRIDTQDDSRAESIRTSSVFRDFCRRTAEIIGNPQLEAPVGRVIDFSNELGILVHGVKDYKRLPLIEENGVLPLTPEGSASYWASGCAIFGGNIDLESPMTRFDTPFFNYGFSKDRDTLERHMILVLTWVSQLSNITPAREVKDEVITIKVPVSRSRITLLHVVDRNSGRSGSQYPLKRIQTEMLRLLEETMSSEVPNDKTVVLTS